MTFLRGAAALSFGAALVLGAACPAAIAAPDIVTTMNDQFFGAPNEFHLYNERDQKVFTFAEPRKVRLCMPSTQVGVGLGRGGTLRYKTGNQSGILRPGDCMTIMAKRVALSPLGEMPQNWEVEGTVKRQG